MTYGNPAMMILISNRCCSKKYSLVEKIDTAPARSITAPLSLLEDRFTRTQTAFEILVVFGRPLRWDTSCGSF
jgi:hypothetical protein